MAYADDVDLVAETVEGVDRKAREFVEAARRAGLTVNEQKTKLMRCRRGETDADRQVQCGGMNVEMVDKFKYLGSVVTAGDEVQEEMKERIAAGARCAGALRRVLTCRWISRAVKVQIYTTVIRPVVLYGAETWRTTKAMERKLDVFENGIMRQICGPVQENGQWRRRHNAELRNLTELPWLSDVMRAQRVRWAGHVARKGENSLTAVAMRGQPEGRRPVGRPRKRWEDGLVEDLRQVGHRGDWGETAQNRDDWRQLVVAARGLRGLTPEE